MGGCLSKKSTDASSPNELLKPPAQVKSNPQVEKKPEENTVKKEIFIIKHRKSHEVERRPEDEERKSKKAVGNGELVNGFGIMGAAQVRTSSCTKEELDAILIQCGRLSRSSSTGKAMVSSSGGFSENGASNLQKGRKYIGSKRSFDFDSEKNREGKSTDDKDVLGVGDDELVGDRESRHRHRPSPSRDTGSSSQRRRQRRTPSRERDKAEQQQRSGSRERASNSGGGRRVSRSPGRRSESPITSSSCGNSSSANGDRGGWPGKMVSVPATVSSLAMDKSNNAGSCEPNFTAGVKRIQVKRNVGADGGVGSRTSASPRARSPARASARVPNENQNNNLCQNQQQPMSLSRSNSRKAEHSPYRRNPLGEIDTNVVMEQTRNNILSQASMQKTNVDNNRVVQGTKNRLTSSKIDNSQTNTNGKTKEQPKVMAEETKEADGVASNVASNVVTAGTDRLKPLAKPRSRSSRLSWDLDINLEELSNPTPSYTALLLEDIQNFQKTNDTPTTFSLPPCLTKACSILEAVADLNSTTSSNLSTTLPGERRKDPLTEQFTKSENAILFAATNASKRRVLGSEDSEKQESSGSNSFTSSQQNRDSSLSEPNSADSTNSSWTSLRLHSKQPDRSQLGFPRHAIFEPNHDEGCTGKGPRTMKTDSDYHLRV